MLHMRAMQRALDRVTRWKKGGTIQRAMQRDNTERRYEGWYEGLKESYEGTVRGTLSGDIMKCIAVQCLGRML
jgi:hypothetical protein